MEEENGAGWGCLEMDDTLFVLHTCAQELRSQARLTGVPEKTQDGGSHSQTMAHHRKALAWCEDTDPRDRIFRI